MYKSAMIALFCVVAMVSASGYQYHDDCDYCDKAGLQCKIAYTRWFCKGYYPNCYQKPFYSCLPKYNGYKEPSPLPRYGPHGAPHFGNSYKTHDNTGYGNTEYSAPHGGFPHAHGFPRAVNY